VVGFVISFVIVRLVVAMSNPAMDVINTTFRADMTFLHPALRTFRNEIVLQSCNIQAKALRSRKHCDP
jgi:hypothetical protein